MTSDLIPLDEEPRARSRRNTWERLVEGEQILADRNNGATVSELCTRYGYAPNTITARIREAAEAQITLETEHQRGIMNALLDDLTGRWGHQVTMSERMAVVGSEVRDLKMMTTGLSLRADALNGALRVAERRARLNGLDAPTKTEATVTHENETDRAIEDLTKMMDAMGDAPAAG